MTRNRLAGGALLLFVAALVAAAVLENARRSAGVDPDDARMGVDYLRSQPRVFVLTGVAFLAMALSLIVGVVGAHESIPLATGLTIRGSVSVLGLVASAMFVMTAALRVSPPGTIGYIDELDPRWGESAYLSIHMIGSQGFLLAGVLLVALWATALSTVGSRDRVVPRTISWLGIGPAAFVITSLSGPLGLVTDLAYPVYLASAVSVFVWVALLGGALLTSRKGAMATRPGGPADPDTASGVAP